MRRNWRPVRLGRFMRLISRADAFWRLAPLLMIGLLPGIANARAPTKSTASTPPPVQSAAAPAPSQTTEASATVAGPASAPKTAAATSVSAAGTSRASTASAASTSPVVTGSGTSSSPAGATATSQQSSPVTAAPPVTASAGAGATPLANNPLALSQAETVQATFVAMTQFTQTLLDPAIDGRGAGAAPALSEQALEAYAAAPSDRTRGGVGRDVYQAFYGRMPLSGPPDATRWNVWASGFGSQVSSRNAAAGSGSSSRIFATAVGADYALSPQTQLGFATAGGGTNFSGGAGSGRSDLFQAGAFVRHAIGRAYVATAFAYGWQAMTSDHPGVDQLNAAFNANAYSARIESGYRFATPWIGVTAYAAGQSMSFNLPTSTAHSASLSNALAMAFGSDRINDSRSELGFRTSTSLALHDGLVNLRARVAWAHDFTATGTMPAALQALPGLGYVASGAALAPNSTLAGGTLELKWQNGWTAAATCDGELSSQVRSYTGKAVLRYAW